MHTELQTAWAAGLFEGEGCIGQSSYRTHRAVLSLGMTDEDTVRAFARIVGGGHIRVARWGHLNRGEKPIYEWRASSMSDTNDVLVRLYPYLYARRSMRALVAFAANGVEPPAKCPAATSLESRIAWAAGLFEAEGCITSSTASPRRARLVMTMTDSDVISAFHGIIQCGNLRIDDWGLRTNGHKLAHRWEAGAKQDVIAVLRLFMPWLQSRRRAKAQEAISTNTASLRTLRTIHE